MVSILNGHPIIAFILFAAICGGAGYLFWKKSALKQDLKDDGIIK